MAIIFVGPEEGEVCQEVDDRQRTVEDDLPVLTRVKEDG